jgi:hypothetical protein
MKRINSRNPAGLIVSAILFFALIMSVASAAAVTDELDCADGSDPIGYLGITGLECTGSFSIGGEGKKPSYRFRAEPVVLTIDMDGPASDILQPGDVIVAIDGMLITTRRAGNHFANPEPGEPMEFTIRRGERELDVRVVPKAICPEDARAKYGEGVPLRIELDRLSKRLEELAELMPNVELEDIKLPAIPELMPMILELPELPEIPELPEVDFFPEGWFGLGIRCDGCTIRHGDDGHARWEFDNPPEVYSVDADSPADRAGLRRGDVLMRVDGVKLDTKKGGERFSDVAPGESVTWTIERDGDERTVTMVAEESPEHAAAPAPPADPAEPEPLNLAYKFRHSHKLRFSGNLGDTNVEVRGLSSVVVTVDEEKGEIVIRTGDATVRLKLAE